MTPRTHKLLVRALSGSTPAERETARAMFLVAMEKEGFLWDDIVTRITTHLVTPQDLHTPYESGFQAGMRVKRKGT